ncbi:hypothetical protein [Methylovirgula sp. HY1]|uniref:hypothetical protein n=1 Tax=Methylovirgula sp. HY1 TaxID=2822761 RepID=UPI001C5AD945|nr:hypothetical protein [Methylovirgula sp. HY1]QXX76484.1 hypothetical protein MHY1_p00006 [Methylovirgula sp. HY1]
MRQKPGSRKAPAEQVINDICRLIHKHYGAEEKIRSVLEGLPKHTLSSTLARSVSELLCDERIVSDLRP